MKPLQSLLSLAPLLSGYARSHSLEEPDKSKEPKRKLMQKSLKNPVKIPEEIKKAASLTLSFKRKKEIKK